MDIRVKQVQPKELPAGCAFRLTHLYHTEVEKFAVITNSIGEIVYVNHVVPQKDIKMFLEVIEYPEYAVNDPDIKISKIIDYIYNKYGFGAYLALIDAHSMHMEKREKEKAAETAKAILPIIEKEINSEMPVVGFDERLMFEIWSAGNNLRRKTPKNIMGYGSVYEFYFGYLMGAGMLKEVMHGNMDVA